MITQESVREVIETAKIADVVGDFVNLRRRGNNFTGLCPFHSEKTPSFNVNPARNIYKCFGCGVGGDPVNFLMELEQLTFPDAIKWIAGKYNIKLEEKELSPEVQEEIQEKESLLLVNEFALRYFRRQLEQTEEGKSIGLSYFRSRGFRKETLEVFGLGFTGTARDGLLQAALTAGYKAEQLEKLGLARQGRDFFRERAMFTIHNLSGKPIAFAGRLLKKAARAPKYINSPETEVYHKSRVLYGMYQARRAVRKADKIYVVEGYTDVISLYQQGIQNVVATSGTSLTDGQATLVKRFTNNVTLLYDGDKAGIRAALRGVDVLLRADLQVRVVVLPEGSDPDSHLQEVGITAFTEYLRARETDFLFFKTDLLLEAAADDVAQRTEAIREVSKTLALVGDPLLRANYLQRLSQRLGIAEQLLTDLVNTAISAQRKALKSPPPVGEPGSVRMAGEEIPQAPASPLPVSGHQSHERYLLTLLARDGHKPFDEEKGVSTAEFITSNVADLLTAFDSDVYRSLVEAVGRELRERGVPQPDWYVQHPRDELREIAIEALSQPYTYSPNWAERYNLHLRQRQPDENHVMSAERFLRYFRMKKIDRKCRENARLIQQLAEEGDEKRLMTHLRVQQKLDAMRIALAKELGTVVLS